MEVFALLQADIIPTTLLTGQYNPLTRLPIPASRGLAMVHRTPSRSQRCLVSPDKGGVEDQKSSEEVPMARGAGKLEEVMTGDDDHCRSS